MSHSHLIVGPGALGRLLAMHLVPQHSVALLGRRPLPDTFTLLTPEGEHRQCFIPSLTANRIESTQPQLELEKHQLELGKYKVKLGKNSIVHFTTKAYATQAALEAIETRLVPQTPLVLWQNGYGIQETLTRQWPGPVLCVSTTEGAYISKESVSEESTAEESIVGQSEVVHAGHGQTVIGHLAGKHKELAKALAIVLSEAGLPCEAVDDIRVRLWQKLAVNAAINPLVARFRIRNGQLRDRPFRPMVETMIAELEPIMAAESIPGPAGGWQALIWRVIEHTANNRASMLQDVLAGRSTEHQAILGPLLETARRHHLTAPTLQEQYRALAQRESQIQQPQGHQ